MKYTRVLIRFLVKLESNGVETFRLKALWGGLPNMKGSLLSLYVLLYPQFSPHWLRNSLVVLKD